MTIKDRTNDFLNLLQAHSTNFKHNASIKKEKTKFASESIRIGKSLVEIKQKIKSLSKLVEKNNLFDDPTAEIGELTVIIKQRVDSLQKDIRELDEVRKEGINKGNKLIIHLGKANEQTEKHNETVITALNNRLTELAKDFSDALQKRSQTTKEQQQRVDVLTGAKPPVLRQRKGVPSSHVESSVMGKGDSVAIPLGMPAQSQQHVFETRSVTSGAVEKIESTLVELQHIFQQVGSLVAEQGEVLDRVDANVLSSHQHINSAQNWLLRYQRAIKGNRGLIIKGFIVTIIIIVMLMLFYR